jgi:hypothetical protein
VGLEVRGGSSDFWAIEGEPRNQFNRHLMSTCCMQVLHPRDEPAPSSAKTDKSQLLFLTAPTLLCQAALEESSLKWNFPVC